jgi:hypothetical protein
MYTCIKFHISGNNLKYFPKNISRRNMRSSVVHLLENFPTCHRNIRLIIMFTRKRHWSPFWARLIQSISPHPTFLKYILILSSHLRLSLPSGLVPFGFPTKALYEVRSSHTRPTRHAHLIFLDLLNLIIFGKKFKLFSSEPCSQIPLVYVLPLKSETTFHTHANLQAQFSFVYINFSVLESRWGGNKFWCEWYKALNEFNLLSISSWSRLWIVTAVPKCLNFITFSKSVLTVSTLWFCSGNTEQVKHWPEKFLCQIICEEPTILKRLMSQDSVVGTATGDGLDDRRVGVRVTVGSRIFSSKRRPDQPWGSPSLLSSGTYGFFPGGKVAGEWSWLLTSS